MKPIFEGFLKIHLARQKQTFKVRLIDLGKTQFPLTKELNRATVKLGNMELFVKELISNKEPFSVTNLPFTSYE